VEVLGLGLELLKAALGVDVDGVLGVLANVELGLELLGRLEMAWPLSVNVLGGCCREERWRVVEEGTRHSCNAWMRCGAATYASKPLLEALKAHSLGVVGLYKRNVAVPWGGSTAGSWV